MRRVAAMLFLCMRLADLHGEERGLASWYGEDHRGRTMANGKPFNPDAMTAASWHFPLGTWVEVRHGSRHIHVQITDRGPNKRFKARIIDLSAAAFKRLEDPRKGLAQVRVLRR